MGKDTMSDRPRLNQAETRPMGPGTGKETPSHKNLRREAYLEIEFRGRTILALLDSGCEQSVIGR